MTATNPTALPSEETLLAHIGWVRKLARQLVREPDRVEDLVQATMTVALENPPRTGAVQSFLGSVARRLAFQDRRSASRRRSREERAARPEAVPGIDAVMERWSVHRLLVEKVEGLAEPYRSTLLLRFFEGCTPRRMAQIQDVSVRTIETRLRRGLAILREDLTRSFGDRESFLAALSGFLRSSPPSMGFPLPWTGLALATPIVAWVLTTALIRESAPTETGGHETFIEIGSGDKSRFETVLSGEGPKEASVDGHRVLRYAEGMDPSSLPLRVRQLLESEGNKTGPGLTILRGPPSVSSTTEVATTTKGD